jgi:hypothetical protein
MSSTFGLIKWKKLGIKTLNPIAIIGSKHKFYLREMEQQE